MTHIDEGTLQALLDDELQQEERRRVEHHLDACERCSGELESLKVRAAHFASAVGLLDRPPRPREHAVGWPRSRRRLNDIRRILPRAAVLLLFAAAAASATVPGSPLRSWITQLTGPDRVEVADAARPQEADPSGAVERIEAGVSVEAVDGKVEIILREASDLAVRAIQVEGTSAGVYAAGAAASSRFHTGAGRIEVLNARDGELRIELPRGAPAATVIINEQEVLQKLEGRLHISADASALEGAGIDFSVDP